MQPLPHHYSVEASASPEGSVALDAGGLPSIPSAPPREFDGPGDHWSPETLLVAAIADCFVLTFRAIARASRFDWESLECRVEARLDRVEGITRFVAATLHADLKCREPDQAAQALRLLEKAERGCLVTNSLAFSVELQPTVS